MNIPSFVTPLAVNRIWHTNWGFAVRHIMGWKARNFFLDYRIAGPHREYVEKLIVPWQRIEHEDINNREWTQSPLLPSVVGYLRARITATLDDIPLDPIQAQTVVREIWWERIGCANHADKKSLAEQREKICAELQKVIDWKFSTILDLDWIFGICCGLEQRET